MKCSLLKSSCSSTDFFFHKYSVVKTEIKARLKHCIFWSSFFRGVFLIRLTGFKTPTLKHVSRLIIKTQNRLIQLLMTQFFGILFLMIISFTHVNK